VLEFFQENIDALRQYIELSGGFAVVFSVLTAIIGMFWSLRTLQYKIKDSKEQVLYLNEIESVTSNRDVTTTELTLSQFIAIRREMKTDLIRELSKAREEERAELQLRITELEAQIANPEPALIEAQQTISELSTRLQRMSNDVGGDSLAEAQEAFRRLDFSVADEIFAEIEARQKLEVGQAARAAFGRGEVAAAAMRWNDAAEHFDRAARFDPSFETLRVAREFYQRAGNYEKAFFLSAELLTISRLEGNKTHLAEALHYHAIDSQQIGLLSMAEALLKEALTIDEDLLGESHPNFAIGLNNLAMVTRQLGRDEEAEALYRQALGVAKKTLSKSDPDYVKHLVNLANVLVAQGNSQAAEPLFREALEIDKNTFGPRHPDYALSLHNLSKVLADLGRFDEAEENYRKAITIAFESLGEGHPNTKLFQANLDALLTKQS